jgi:hypothetical protein
MWIGPHNLQGSHSHTSLPTWEVILRVPRVPTNLIVCGVELYLEVSYIRLRDLVPSRLELLSSTRVQGINRYSSDVA